MALKILLADDSLTAQNMGKKILTEAGYEVIAVSNGAQALKKIVSENPDLVVLDVYMPGYSGLELCERMHSSRETATIPIILSVGKMEAFQPEEGNRVHADGLIVKPFEATELVAAVKKLAENVSAARSKPSPEPEPAPEPPVEATSSAVVPSTAEPEFEIQHQAVEIPREVASVPVAGMELIPEDIPEAAQQQQPAAPIEFELEQAPARVEFDSAPRMAAADGLSGVFEMEPSAPPAVEAAAAPALLEGFESFSTPAEAPSQFEEAHAPSKDSIATTVEHDFGAVPPEAYEDEARPEFTAGPVIESFSQPAAVEPPSSVKLEETPLSPDPPEASAGNGTAQATAALPELTSWDDAVIMPSAETPHVPADSIPNNSETEFAPPTTVWMAEEVPMEPHEFAIPLHQQMERQAQETPEPTLAATLAESSEREAFVPSCAEPAAAANPAAPQLEAYAADDSQPVPQNAVPMMTEAPVDPARIASIVELVLERLKPELVAAVTRELEKNET